jgi:uncharacterized protein YigE (DUF2233 family)
MYGEDHSPIGLYIEDGRQLAPVNTRNVPADVKPVPNFYKKPNGIFYVGKGGAGVMTTEAFLAAKPDARFATQSGPMLVIDGEVHQVFIPGSRPKSGTAFALRRGQGAFVITERSSRLRSSSAIASVQGRCLTADGLGARSPER